MAKLDARQIQKRNTISGTTPTVAPSDDHLDNTWSNVDIYECELFFNVPDKKIYTRFDDEIHQIYPSTGGTGGDTLFEGGLGSGSIQPILGDSFANGDNSFAMGNSVTASGIASIALGYDTLAYGFFSQAENQSTLALGDNSHAEGYITSATGYATHSEGFGTLASGNYSHVEGNSSHAQGNNSHAEGYQTSATNDSSHAEGYGTIASGQYGSHSEGLLTQATGNSSHAEGSNTIASGQYGAHAEGYQTIAAGNSTHAEGYQSMALLDGAHAEGYITSATSLASHAEGLQTLASAFCAHAEGYQTIANANYTHSEGYQTNAKKLGSHAEGQQTIANGDCSHSEGYQTITDGYYSHIGGYQSYNLGQNSFVHSYSAICLADDSAIISGFKNKLESSANNSVILGGQNITGTSANTVYAPNINASGVIYSGSINLYSIFAPIGLSGNTTGGTFIQNGTNTFTGGTSAYPRINITSATFANLSTSGTNVAIQLSATTLSGGTIYSGSTNLYNIFALAGVPIATLNNGTNTFTGGTTLNPSINITSATLANLSTSGINNNFQISAITVSANTLYSNTGFFSNSLTVSGSVNMNYGGGGTRIALAPSGNNLRIGGTFDNTYLSSGGWFVSGYLMQNGTDSTPTIRGLNSLYIGTLDIPTASGNLSLSTGVVSSTTAATTGNISYLTGNATTSGNTAKTGSHLFDVGSTVNGSRGNIAFFTNNSLPTTGGLERGIFLGNATSGATGSPVNGLSLYSSSGDFNIKTSSGALITLGASSTFSSANASSFFQSSRFIGANAGSLSIGNASNSGLRVSMGGVFAGPSYSTSGTNVAISPSIEFVTVSETGTGTTDMGDIFISPGISTGSGRGGAIHLNTTVKQTGIKGGNIFIGNCAASPVSANTSGAFLYVTGGTLYKKDMSNTGIVATVSDLSNNTYNFITANASLSAFTENTLFLNGTFNLTLSDPTLYAGREYVLKNISASNTVTLIGQVDVTINPTLAPLAFIKIKSTGAGWYQIG